MRYACERACIGVCLFVCLCINEVSDTMCACVLDRISLRACDCAGISLQVFAYAPDYNEAITGFVEVCLKPIK